jgi:hypothetical protein
LTGSERRIRAGRSTSRSSRSSGAAADRRPAGSTTDPARLPKTCISNLLDRGLLSIEDAQERQPFPTPDGEEPGLAPLALVYKSLQAVKTFGALPPQDELLKDTIQLVDEAMNKAVNAPAEAPSTSDSSDRRRSLREVSAERDI